MSTAKFVQGSELDTLLANPGVVVVDCTATWCGPCRKVAPLIDQLAAEYEDRATVVKMDLDQNKEKAKQFSVRSIPAILFFKNGELAETIVGLTPYEKFTETLDQCLATA